MSWFSDKVASLWQERAQGVVHGWIPDPAPPAAAPGAGRHYLQVRCSDLAVEFSRHRGAQRRPLLQSLVRWPNPKEQNQISVSATVGADNFKNLGDDDYAQMVFTDVALTGELPLNGPDVDVAVALLAVPGDSIFTGATKFLTSLAELTQVPALSQAAPVAQKIAGGIDSVLGNDKVEGVLAFRTTVPSTTPRPGCYVVTDWPVGQGRLDWLRVRDGRLELRYQQTGWGSPVGRFGYLVLEFRVDGAKPNRWNTIPQVRRLFDDALDALARSRNVDDAKEAGVQMRLAAVAARGSADLTIEDAALAVAAIAGEWKDTAASLGVGLESLEGTGPELDPEQVAAITAQARRQADAVLRLVQPS